MDDLAQSTPTLTAMHGEQTGQDFLAHAAAGSLPVHEVVSTLQASGGSRGYRVDAEAAGGGTSSSCRRVVAALTSNGVGTCGPDDNQAQAGHLVTHTHLPEGHPVGGARDVNGNLPPEVWAERDVAATLNLHDLGSDTRAVELVTTTLGDRTHALTAEDHDASEDGTGRGTPVIAHTLTAGTSRPGVNPPGRRQEDDHNLVAFQPQAAGDAAGDAAGSLSASAETAPCLSTGQVAGIASETTVRRLTPLECERLQGFPDGWTDGQADTHRYKQMGNAVAVPVFAWVARRLIAIDKETR